MTDTKTLAEKIRKSSSSNVVETKLMTDERVIARVTDGIYRQPSSALRELISNAYDADATKVVLKTDYPRFGRVSIEDNGHGMTPEVLAHLLLHIGGSAKRSIIGAELGVTNKKDHTKSPGGRKLIGKIGIGLFSVSQLTHSFQIVTKVQGDKFRTIATVAMRQYSDRDIDERDEFESAKVNIWCEPATDIKAHGTSIILTQVRREAIDTLRSRSMWNAIEQSEMSDDEFKSLEPPKYHVGRVDESGNLLKKTAKGTLDSLPWKRGDGPEEAFEKLVDCTWEELEDGNRAPELEKLFDYYLQMIWQLSLAVPLPYVEGHLFDEPSAGWLELYKISNKKTGTADAVKGAKSSTIRKQLDLKDPLDDSAAFELYVDDLKLSRPIKFRNLPESESKLKKPMVFIGKCHNDFNNLPVELSGGPLTFEAYLFWTPKVVPKEHQGSLVRIHGASGTGFDSGFMRYKTSEINRTRQIVCEVFVSQGLESALNIDRESFNNAHPHSVFIAKWLHSALLQYTNTHKRRGKEESNAFRATSEDSAVRNIQKIAYDAWAEEVDDPASNPPEVEFVEEEEEEKPKRQKSGAYKFSRAKVAAIKNRNQKTRIIEEKLKAILQILASYGLLDGISKKKQNQLAKSIFEVLESSE